VIHDTLARALHVLDPEDAHSATMLGLKLGLGPVDRTADHPILPTTLAGIPLSGERPSAAVPVRNLVGAAKARSARMW